MAQSKALDYKNITLTRKEVASILNCTPLTINNREKKDLYPPPKRNSSSKYRIYDLSDVFLLQMITFNRIILPTIVSLLYDKGYTDSVEVEKVLNAQFNIFKYDLDAAATPLAKPLRDYTKLGETEA